MKLSTWNVNSVRARLGRVIAWLETNRPDVLCLQEVKVEDAKFPTDGFRALGYHLATHGQKTYNGVAILSLTPPSAVERGFGDGAEDPQARFLAASVAGIRVMTAYVPNGEAVGSAKFAYKLAWLERLRRYLAMRLTADAPAGLRPTNSKRPSPYA